MPVIGFLNGGTAEGYARATDSFQQGLKETGYIVGQNMAIEYRWAQVLYDRLPAETAAELAGGSEQPRRVAEHHPSAARRERGSPISMTAPIRGIVYSALWALLYWEPTTAQQSPSLPSVTQN